ncbi:MAG: pyridoxamine 5'-phosphate oxidase family protein [Rubrobacter sp.]|nr:pyridoxamine 5'-phosphate oxidase family protein [Rubrobacter sp.]
MPASAWPSAIGNFALNRSSTGCAAKKVDAAYSQPDRQKLRNIARNPRVGFNLNSSATGGDVARAECTAEVVEDAPPANEVPEYLEKYRGSIARIGLEPESFARAYSVALRLTPSRWQVW